MKDLYYLDMRHDNLIVIKNAKSRKHASKILERNKKTLGYDEYTDLSNVIEADSTIVFDANYSERYPVIE